VEVEAGLAREVLYQFEASYLGMASAMLISRPPHIRETIAGP